MKNPYVVQRIAHDDGGFHYEILDWRPGSYRIVCWVDEDEAGDRMQAKRDADMIAHALNGLDQSETEIERLRAALKRIADADVRAFVGELDASAVARRSIKTS